MAYIVIINYCPIFACDEYSFATILGLIHRNHMFLKGNPMPFQNYEHHTLESDVDNI